MDSDGWLERPADEVPLPVLLCHASGKIGKTKVPADCIGWDSTWRVRACGDTWQRPVGGRLAGCRRCDIVIPKLLDRSSEVVLSAVVGDDSIGMAAFFFRRPLSGFALVEL